MLKFYIELNLKSCAYCNTHDWTTCDWTFNERFDDVYQHAVTQYDRYTFERCCGCSENISKHMLLTYVIILQVEF